MAICYTLRMASVPVAQASRFAELESVIQRGLATFVEVGAALTEIRERRLYRDGFTSFEQYCKDRWGFNRQRAAQLIGAARLSTIVDSPLPSEGVARELAPLKNDAPRLRAAWAEVVAEKPKPTAQDVRAVLRRVTIPDDEGPDESSAQALSDEQAQAAFDALSDACAIVADLKPPREFLAMLPGSVQEYPLIQLRRASAWLRAFFEEIEPDE